ncbi:MAG TPA: DUF4118 domain-containing protein [Syntrophomonadaceae bacterium]|nr:DUF4118 domain-containing protein [Syntrophomonadaceae bacterium]
MSKELRRDPEAILAQIKSENRGKLTVFLGAAAGVGKTYAMLETAREKRLEGFDVVAGWIDTHGRRETEALLDGLELAVPLQLEYRGKMFQEMDLDGMLQRHPQIALVDELAHTNIQGARHTRRYQDVEELLEAGINVYTTFNIQHVESLNDTVAQITGVHVRETVPDRFLESADQIKLIDIPAEELIQRLEDGKVYIPELAQQALKNFFRLGNINALRELTLRHAARRVGQQMEEYRFQHGIDNPWPAVDRVMACISSSPFAAQVLRRARQVADNMKAELITVYIEPPYTFGAGKNRDNLARNLQLAEDLGAKIVTISSTDVAAAILNLARQYNVSQIILGKPLHPRWRELLHGTVVDEIIRGSAGMGVYVVPGEPILGPHAVEEKENTPPRNVSIWSYLLPLSMVAVITVLGNIFVDDLGLTNIGMLFLLPVLFASVRLGLTPAILAALVSMLAFDIFFVPPILRLTVSDVRYLITFAAYLLVAVTTGSMADRLRLRMQDAIHRETRTRALYDLARELSAVTDMDLLARKVVDHVSQTVDAETVLYLPGEGERLRVAASSKAFSELVMGPNELAVAEWSYCHSQASGAGTDTLPGAKGFYLPVKTEEITLGVLGIKPSTHHFTPEQITLIQSLAGLTALAVGRLRLALEAQEMKTQEESERLRSGQTNS